MTDIYLRAASEAEAKAALPEFVTVAGDWICTSHSYALDPIGAIAGAEGWHANLRLLDEGLLPEIELTGLMIEEPATPHRVWA